MISDPKAAVVIGGLTIVGMIGVGVRMIVTGSTLTALTGGWWLFLAGGMVGGAVVGLIVEKASKTDA